MPGQPAPKGDPFLKVNTMLVPCIHTFATGLPWGREITLQDVIVAFKALNNGLKVTLAIQGGL